MSNYSKQRELILETLNHMHHPTVEQLYLEVHKNSPTISKSTVYRNLNILLEDNIIKKIKLFNGPDRFDCKEKEHHHVICENCGKVFDFIYPFKKDELKQIIKDQTRATTSVDSITVYGICEDCKSKIMEE